jgi:hypothetical protein
MPDLFGIPVELLLNLDCLELGAKIQAFGIRGENIRNVVVLTTTRRWIK